MNDWTPTPDARARRLFQVRAVLVHLHLPLEHREGLEELASNLEKFTIPKPAPQAPKGS